MRRAHPVYANLGTTVFESMSQLARSHDAVNLGQGFPDGGEPRDVIEHAARALTEGWNQYPPMLGLPELRQAVATHARRFFDLDLDWQRETMVTSGATEAIAAAILALVEPGDEVVLVEPLYDAYLPLVLRAGGVPRFVRLSPPHWRLERAALAAVASARTKCFIVNTPMNPTGHVFDAAEIDALAEIATGCDAYVIGDEVYEHLVFDGHKHASLLAHPGLRDRTIRIGSAGKTFSLTGWKVGYVSAAPELLTVVGKAHQFLTFTTPPNLQSAIAYGLGKDDTTFAALVAEMQRKRDHFAAGLQRLGLSALPCEGTYFLNVDIAAFGKDDVTFCRDLVTQIGVAAIPVSAFYAEAPVTSIARFCFAKRDEVLDAALGRLARLRQTS